MPKKKKNDAVSQANEVRAAREAQMLEGSRPMRAAYETGMRPVDIGERGYRPAPMINVGATEDALTNLARQIEAEDTVIADIARRNPNWFMRYDVDQLQDIRMQRQRMREEKQQKQNQYEGIMGD